MKLTFGFAWFFVTVRHELVVRANVKDINQHLRNCKQKIKIDIFSYVLFSQIIFPEFFFQILP